MSSQDPTPGSTAEGNTSGPEPFVFAIPCYMVVRARPPKFKPKQFGLPIAIVDPDSINLGTFSQITVERLGAFALMTTEETLQRVVEVLLALRYIRPQPTLRKPRATSCNPEGPFLDPAIVSTVCKSIRVVKAPPTKDVPKSPSEVPPEVFTRTSEEAYREGNGAYWVDPLLGIERSDDNDRNKHADPDGKSGRLSDGLSGSVAVARENLGRRRVAPTNPGRAGVDPTAPIRVRRGIGLTGPCNPSTTLIDTKSTNRMEAE